MSSKWTEIGQYGQSVWYDNVARPALASGLLERLRDADHVTGGTSNPSIFAKAVLDSDLYDDDIADADADASPNEVFLKLAIADIQNACDVMRGVFESTGGLDGYISLEVEADLAFDTAGTVTRAHELRDAVDRPNVMIKVPGTEPGIASFRQLTRDGVSVNVTLLFSVARYGAIAEAYVAALTERAAAGEDISKIASVASFFVSRIDTKVDDQLPEGSPLRGKIAVANAKVAYADVFQPVHSGPRWEALAEKGANPQRALWASTGVKNKAYSPTLYIDTLIGPNTVNTVPDAALDAFRDDGTPGETLTTGVDEARSQLAALASEGVDLDAITTALEADGVKQFAEAYDGMLEAIAKKHSAVKSA
jgi:transaldolase/glucose-6-phosphate isomerase